MTFFPWGFSLTDWTGQKKESSQNVLTKYKKKFIKEHNKAQLKQ